MQYVIDGWDGWIYGWLVSTGHTSSKSTFGAKNWYRSYQLLFGIEIDHN